MNRTVLSFLLWGVLSQALHASEAEKPTWRIEGSASSRYTVSAAARGVALVQSEVYGVARRDYANLFNNLTNELSREQSETGERIVITATSPQVGLYRRTLSNTPKSLIYEGAFEVPPNAINAEIASVSLYLSPELLNGAEWVAQTDNGEVSGVLPDPEPRQNIAVGIKRIQFDTTLGMLTFSFSGKGPWTLDDLHGLDWAEGRPYRLDLQLQFPPAQGLAAQFRAEVSFEPRTPPADWFVTVDISKQATTALSDDVAGDRKGGWIDQGPDDLRNLVSGTHRFLGAPFRVLDSVENNGRSALVLQGGQRPYFPIESAPIPVKERLQRLYFLHCCAWGTPPGAEAGQYVIEYEGGTKVSLPLHVGGNIADWWTEREPSTPDVATAWQGENEVCTHDVRLFALKWDNPRPALPIKSITAIGSGEGPILCLVAVTGVKTEGVPDSALKLLDHLFVKEEDLLSSARPVEEWLPIDLPWQATETNDLDISPLLEAPAGRHGFVEARGGRLYFADGMRAKFWGTAIAAPCAFGPHETAEKIAMHLAQCGCNLVRIHGLQVPDTGAGMSLVDYERYQDSQHWQPEVLDRLDYFIAEMKKRGVYVYLDLLTRRRFRDGDGLPGVDAFMDGKRYSWGQGPCAKPVSTFNRRMIELQKEFATQLLTHENRYTGLRLVDDPAIALIEITNENSMFWQSDFDALPDPYVGELRWRWNEWLLRKYAERDALGAAWAKLDAPLAPDEDPRLGTVRFRKVANHFDMALFAYEVMRDYHTEMVKHLRTIDVKVPITGHNSPQRLPDIRGVADSGANFLSIHGYWDLTGNFAERKPTQRSPLYKNPFKTLVGDLAVARTRNLPFMVTEVNYCWPNRFRAEGAPIIAAYASLQDWDGVIWFSHSGGYGINTWDHWKDSIYYHTQLVKDPSVWGQFRMGAEIFLEQKVSPARTVVENGYSDTDCFFNGSAAHPKDPLDALVHVARCQNAFFKKEYKGRCDVAIASGMTPDVSYLDAQRAFLFAGQPFADLKRTVEDRLRPIQELYPKLEYYAGPASLVFEGIGFDSKRIEADLTAGIRVNSIPQGSRPIGVDEGRGVALGFINDRHCILPDLPTLDNPERMLLYRTLLDALDWWGYTSLNHSLADRQVFVSDTGELVRDFGKGTLTINSPEAQGAVGFIGSGEAVELKDVSILSGSSHAAITLVSLDGKPLGESEKILLTAVADSANTGQNPDAEKEGGLPVIFDPVEAGIGIRSRLAPRLRVSAVDPQTGKTSEGLSTTVNGQEVTFRIGPEHKTIFYLIESK